MYIISDEESKRIDLLRAVLVVCVVFVHSYSTGFQFVSGDIEFHAPLWLDAIRHVISRGIGTAGVPCFFLISSVLLYRKDFRTGENLKRKVRSLLIPYLVFNSVWILIFYLAQCIPAVRNFFPDPATVVSLWGPFRWADAYLGLDGYPMLYPLWYLRDLMLLNLLAHPVRLCVKKSPRVVFFLFLAVWVFLPEKDGMFRESIQSVCFWVFGCCMVYSGVHITDADSLPKWLYAAVYLLFAVTDETVYRIFPGTELYCVVHRLQILAAAGFLFGFFARTRFSGKTGKLLLLLSGCSFEIYLLHENFLTVLKKLCAFIFPATSGWLLAEYFLIPVFVIALCIFIRTVLKNFFPRLYGFAFGVRKQRVH